MSVLILGMEPSTRCLGCDFEIYGQYCVLLEKYTNDTRKTGRLDNCPVVGLPEKHGDLIDRNALKKDYRMGTDCYDCESDWKACQYDRTFAKMDFCGWLDDAPTVIEAEGEQ